MQALEGTLAPVEYIGTTASLSATVLPLITIPNPAVRSPCAAAPGSHSDDDEFHRNTFPLEGAVALTWRP